MGGFLSAAGRSGWLGGLEADWLTDEDDVDAAGQFLVDLEDLPDLAVLPVGGLRAGVFQRQAVLIDALMRRCQRRHKLKLPAIEVSGCDPIPVILRASSLGRQARMGGQARVM